LAKVSKTVVCQAFSHCKLATYFVRYVLSTKPELPRRDYLVR
jgi:hypothetical protein